MNGLKDIISNESSFKIELIFVLVLLPILYLLPLDILYKLVMFMALMGILIAEAINSAIERVTDLVTLDYHEMAGRAKDAGSAVVFLSIVVCAVVWGFCFMHIFF